MSFTFFLNVHSEKDFVESIKFLWIYPTIFLVHQTKFFPEENLVTLIKYFR